MRLHFPLLTALTVEVCLIGALLAQTKQGEDTEPDAYTYKRVDGKELQAYVFEPQHTDYGKPRAAMLVFHGGPGTTVPRHGPSGRRVISRRWGW